MRHAFRYDDNVARLYCAAGESHHRTAAGRTVEDCRHFAVWRGSPPVDEGTPSDQGRATRYDDVTFSRVIVEYPGGTCRAGTFFAACRSGVCGRRAATGIGTAARHCTAVDDRDPQLVLIHIN